MNQTPVLASEEVVVSAPMSFHGSAVRIWRITRGAEGGTKWAVGAIAVLLITCAWIVVLAWYLIFGLLLVPYRLIRRGSRKRKQQALQHQELLAAVQQQQVGAAPAVPAPQYGQLNPSTGELVGSDPGDQ